MARRPNFVLRKAERGIDLPATDRADISQLHHLSEFLAWGTITIGHIDRAGPVAIAARKESTSTSCFADFQGRTSTRP